MSRWVSGAAIDEMPMIDPPPLAAIAAPACLMVRNAPSRLTAITLRHASSVVITIGPPAPMPAAATAMCSAPSPLALACSTAATTWSSSATSQVIVATVAEDPLGTSPASDAAPSSRRDCVRPHSVTDAPSRRSIRADARPMPLPPPVISADMPSSGPLT